MNENRRQILDLLAGGKITADEAERLLHALERGSSQGSSSEAAEPRAKIKPKYLRVQVEDGSEAGGATKVNIRVPMQLLRAGVRLTSLIPDQARRTVNEAMRERGVFIDLNQLRPENLEEVIEQLSELTVDVDQDRQRVRVYCE